MVIMLYSIKYKEWILLNKNYKKYQKHKNSIIKWYQQKEIKYYPKVLMEKSSKLKSSIGIVLVLEIQLIIHHMSEMD